MNISLTPKTQKLLEKQLRNGQFAGPDELVRFALQTLEQNQIADYDDLDQPTKKAIEQAEAQYQKGEYQPWSKVRSQLRKRFIK